MVPQSRRSPLAAILKIGASLDDAQDIRLQKSLLVYGSFMFIVAGALWSIVYLVFHETLAAMIPLSYAIVSFLSIVHFGLTHHYRFFRASQLVLILLLPFLLMVVLGGYIDSSAVILWSFISPLGALLFAEYKQSSRWLIAYLALLVLSGLLQDLVGSANHLPQSLVIVFFVLNIGTVSSIVFVLLHYFVGQKELAYRLLRIEQDRSESLLLNVLPREIAARLKGGERVIADHHPSVSIMFADLVGFTPLTNQLSPTAMVELLNDIYSHFDSLIEKHGVEKIRTIGDNYMIASGLPQPRADHAQAIADLALEMNAYIAGLAPVGDRRLTFRFGINSGPVIAGVIGHKKFAYDVWGDTANIASRMESQGVPGKIQITQATYELIKADFVCEPHGAIDVKGKGPMQTWFLIRDSSPA
ncbi:MAG: adenylate/guanylate cyclase domain-containing protein [Omnitrophica WOR_2 bacterium]